MPELLLKLSGHAFVLIVAAIAWGLENKWRDRRTRVRRNWTRILLASIVLGSIINGASTWHSHGRQQMHQERIARIDQGVQELVDLARERDPGLTEQEALNEVIVELRALRKRTSVNQAELQGLKRYRVVAELNGFGLSGRVGPGSGLSETSAISLALEQAYDRKEDGGQVTFLPRCDSTGRTAFQKAATLNPDFPFAHWALALCAQQHGDPSWRSHAQRAVTILEHTTQIVGHHAHHDQVLEQLMQRLGR